MILPTRNDEQKQKPINGRHMSVCCQVGVSRKKGLIAIAYWDNRQAPVSTVWNRVL
jgi:hypothetical protein